MNIPPPARPARSFRLVCEPSRFPLVESLLQEEGFRFDSEPFSHYCRQLAYEPFPLGSSLAAFFGLIYIQDRSSMLPPLALDPPEGACVLDLAASPGSKTSFLCQLAGASGLVTANEPNSARLVTLKANLQTMNLFQAVTASYPGEELPLEATWDYILLDPPCSGWGTARKNPAAPKIWHGNRITPLIHLQRRLLEHATALLRPGGKLLYSTCTTNPEENEEQINFAINELGLEALPLAPFPGFMFKDNRKRGLEIDGEASRAQGFYLCLLQKPKSETTRACLVSCKRENEQMDRIDLKNLANPVFDPSLLPAGEGTLCKNKVHFLPQKALDHLPTNIKWVGMPLGKIIGGRFLPNGRLRKPLPLDPRSPRVVLDSISDLRRLLSGAAISTNLQYPVAALWYKDLALGNCSIKNGRALVSFR